ncbi:Uncharacterized damage-inducible protein DinB (forms a four-helix bundle) [Marinobacterium stanieri]|uniref:Uncharacterized damage-inducible protein DinB (Forms a four-helix bundle) n=2 Tax=Marinobacterium stanieri TaxID=49186 RepID=A0A1N6UWH7_9GAMM|nr:DinB family protein [Marinobacterium stanieri]SIQ69596.1 Uncharacterized damage-inducible protein DinB (forms a four-helix bundle) [Marinobacterium stanieri]
MTYTQVLTRYKAWADDLFLTVIASIPDSELTASRPIAFGSLIRTLNHSCTMDYVWQCHLLGQHHGLTTRNPESCPEIEVIVRRQRDMNEWYVGYAGSITDNELAEVVEFEFIGGGAGCMSRRDILLHVVNHNTYHRGHAADILYHLNVCPPTTDLPVFLQQQSVGI